MCTSMNSRKIKEYVMFHNIYSTSQYSLRTNITYVIFDIVLYSTIIFVRLLFICIRYHESMLMYYMSQNKRKYYL